MPDTFSRTTYDFDHDTLEIPEWLKISAEDRKAAWGNARSAPVVSAAVPDQKAAHQRELADKAAAGKAARIKAKNARGLAKVREKHANERYVRPKRKDGRIVVPGHWVPKETPQNGQDT